MELKFVLRTMLVGSRCTLQSDCVELKSDIGYATAAGSYWLQSDCVELKCLSWSRLDLKSEKLQSDCVELKFWAELH